MNQSEARTLSQMEQAVGLVPTHEEAMEFPAYRLGMTLHNVVLAFWNNNEVIRRLNTNPATGKAHAPLLRPAPYGKNSQDEDGAWNFSWKAPEDELFNEPTDRTSMFYTIYPDGKVVCSENPNDQLNIANLTGMLNLAVVIVSDGLEIPSAAFDGQATAKKVASQLFGVTL